ncbi:MAG TPA: DedA family protein [Myxococcales bacterium]|nr:DedA family protein [Myxococcales bacterium]
MEHALAHFLSQFTYLALVGVLAAAGLGVPISEDLTLLLGGGLAAREVTRFWPTLVCGYFGVLLGDVLIHHWGKRMGPAAYEHRIVRKHMSLQRQEKLRAHFARHGFWTIVVGRHTPMLRAPIFFLAGASKLPVWKFALADALSAAVTVPIVVTLGYEFAEHMDEIRAKIHHVEWIIGGAAALAIAALWFWRRRRKRASVDDPQELRAGDRKPN